MDYEKQAISMLSHFWDSKNCKFSKNTLILHPKSPNYPVFVSSLGNWSVQGKDYKPLGFMQRAFETLCFMGRRISNEEDFPEISGTGIRRFSRKDQYNASISSIFMPDYHREFLIPDIPWFISKDKVPADLSLAYEEANRMHYAVVSKVYALLDAGTFESMVPWWLLEGLGNWVIDWGSS